MRKLLGFFTLTFLAFTLDIVRAETPKWRKSESVQKKNESTGRYYFKNCSVEPRKDGQGVFGSVNRMVECGAWCSQYVEILVSQNVAKLTVSSTACFHMDKDWIAVDSYAEEENPRLFETACGPALKRLPSEVRELFFGEFDVGSLPSLPPK